jgi:hypothetical protein
MNYKGLSHRVSKVCFVLFLFTMLGCREGERVSASGSPLNAEAQKAAQRYADLVFVKCGDSSYATDGGQIWQLRNMKVVVQPQNPQIAENYQEERKRKGIDWYGDIHFECTSGRIYNYGWLNWPRGTCGYESSLLVHEKGLWLYGMGNTLEEVQKRTKRASCDKIPQ